MRQGYVPAARVAQGSARVQSQRVGDDADAVGGIVPRSHPVCECYLFMKLPVINLTAGWRPRPARETADSHAQARTDGQSHPLAERDLHTDEIVNCGKTGDVSAEYMPTRVAGYNK